MDLQREFGKQVQLIPIILLLLLREGEVINMKELYYMTCLPCNTRKFVSFFIAIVSLDFSLTVIQLLSTYFYSVLVPTSNPRKSQYFFHLWPTDSHHASLTEEQEKKNNY